MVVVEINNTQKALDIDETRLTEALRSVLEGENIRQAQVSLVVVGAGKMHELNRRHLAHDYPTDVLSFTLERTEERLEGEIIVSADEALLNAANYGWSAEAELTLYAIHGALHLCGYDDLDDDAAAVMHERERHWTVALKIGGPSGANTTSSSVAAGTFAEEGG